MRWSISSRSIASDTRPFGTPVDETAKCPEAAVNSSRHCRSDCDRLSCSSCLRHDVVQHRSVAAAPGSPGAAHRRVRCGVADPGLLDAQQAAPAAGLPGSRRRAPDQRPVQRPRAPGPPRGLSVFDRPGSLPGRRGDEPPGPGLDVPHLPRLGGDHPARRRPPARRSYSCAATGTAATTPRPTGSLRKRPRSRPSSCTRSASRTRPSSAARTPSCSRCAATAPRARATSTRP